MDLPDPPPGWALKSLIENDGVWKVFLYSKEEWCCAGGTTPRYAMLDGIRRIEEGDVYVNLSGMKSRAETADMLQILGIAVPEFKKRI